MYLVSLDLGYRKDICWNRVIDLTNIDVQWTKKLPYNPTASPDERVGRNLQQLFHMLSAAFPSLAAKRIFPSMFGIMLPLSTDSPLQRVILAPRLTANRISDTDILNVLGFQKVSISCETCQEL